MCRRLILLSFILLIVSCSSPQIGFTPFWEILPDARVGVPYNQEIIIGTNLEDNPEFLTAENTKVDIYPADIGLQVLSNKKRRDGLPVYNFLSISGVPSESGTVKVSISGFTYGSMYTKSGKFNKTYSLKVK
ncbi:MULTISPECIES: DNA cytosine methyltransferase [Pantoea]|uniref:DNA cytosine methyltransferase n=1 Tax=Pantoea TaxID=53335 RepID=UPI000FFBC913|nr:MULTISPECIES: DNA cytosine methyltransferase [Pantoea]